MTWRRVGLALVALWFGLGGAAHFVWTDRFVAAVPPALPWREAAVWISGAFELLGAIGVLLSRTRAAAGVGLCLLTVAVTPANVYMWQHPALFPAVSPGLLFVRLPLQLALLACIWLSTQPRRSVS